MYLPASVTLSKRVTDHFRTVKKHTGVNNNVLARIAMSLALESGEDISRVPKPDGSGQTLDRDLLFGDLVEAYEVFIREYLAEMELDVTPGHAITSLVEIGAHKMGHVRSLEQLTKLA